mgnify:CR=1 FL=1|jgi:hypothetical protein|tara:strand:- start:72 stop:437 length:366 start_codon:yes stop_codon:yes gene_type:complete
MKDLTKEEITKIVKTSNRDTLEEYFPSEVDQATKAREETLQRYGGYVNSAKNFLDQIIERAKGDYENGVINAADIDYLINDQCERAMQAVSYVKSSLIALKGPGIKDGEKGPIYPTSRYEE